MAVMVSFRVDDDDIAAADRWAHQLGVERSELLRTALAAHLARLAFEGDVASYDAQPCQPDETALDGADDWGPGRGLVRLDRIRRSLRSCNAVRSGSPQSPAMATDRC